MHPEPQSPEQADMMRRIDNMRRMAQEKEERAAAQPKPAAKKSAEIIPLPLFHKEAPAAPNAALRSALFSAIHSKDRKFLNNELIASVVGIDIKLKGEQLNQDDLEVLLVSQNEARQHPDTLTCQLSERGFLKLLGRKTGSDIQKALNESLVRLQQPVTVKIGRFSYSGGFIHHVYKDDLTKRYVIQLNPRLGALLNSGWTALDIETRRALAGKPLALWLQAFYATHAKPFDYEVETLRELCGSQTLEPYKYRQNLKKAVAVWKATGDIQDGIIYKTTDPKTHKTIFKLHIEKIKKIARRKPV
jgi:TrfA protein